MEKLNVAYIQTHLIWENSDANLSIFEKKLAQIENAHLVVLPEMFNTGFTMNVENVAQEMNGKVITWLKNNAAKYGFALAGSVIVKANGKHYNRFIFAYPNGDVNYYDKRHLFRMGNEHEQFDAGTRMPIFDYLGWRIRPLVCYDLRFPVWSRNRNNYDLLLYVANWPSPRSEVWKILLKARAIENQCYVIGVNRVGTDGMNISYTGDSMVIDPKGIIINELPTNTEGMGQATLCLNALNDFRKKFPVHLDADNFEIN